MNCRLVAVLVSLVLFILLGFGRAQFVTLQAQSTDPVLTTPTIQDISPVPTFTPTPNSGFGDAERFTVMTTTLPSQVDSYLCGQLVKTNGGLTQWLLPCSGNPQLLVLNYSQPTTPPGLVDSAYYRVSDPQLVQVSQQCHPTFGCTTTAILIIVDSAPYDNWEQINSCDVSCAGGNTQPDLGTYQGAGWEFPVVPSSVTGTSSLNTLYANQPTYFDWGVQNQGNATPGALYYVDLFIDSTRFIHYPFDRAPDPSGYFWFLDWNHPIDTPGWHTVKIVVDSENAISESNETNNVWERQFYWQPPTPTNQAPTVNAGIDQTITLPGSATLDGTVSDDGLPNPPGAVTTSWSKISGPGTVTFGNAAAVDTTTSFSAPGVYVLRLTANDSVLSAFDEVTITANQQAPCYTLATSVSPSGSGQITPTPAPNCQGGKYTQGTAVSLSATASTGYAFSHWSGSANGTANPLAVTMDGNKNITANFGSLGFSCNNVTEIPKVECEALVALYNSTNGPNWTNKSGWLVTNTPCSWLGVSCTNNRVTGLSLQQNQLRGSLPSQLGNLSNLQTLTLYLNQLSGPIPADLGKLANLQTLSLSNNQLSGGIPAQLGNLKSLQQLHIHFNPLGGSIPPELGNLTNLQGLDMGGIQVSGAIPPQLGKLANLQGLVLDYNPLSGNIPPQIGDLSKLTLLYLDNTQLIGALPNSLTKLALDTFVFHNSSLCEPTDATVQNWLASIPHLSSTNVKCASASSISGRVTDGPFSQVPIAVDARTEWQDTGIAVQTGDQVQVTYVSGTWTIWKGVDPYTDANGQVGRTNECASPLPSANIGGLVGRVSTGAVQFLGNSGSLVAQHSGTLYLSMNDCAGTFADNDGTLTVQVTIIPASNHPIVGVIISDNAGQTATTDASGNYILSNLAAGTYTLTPSKSGYTFSPSSLSITAPPNKADANFIAISTDVSRIVFAAYRDGNADIYTMNADGSSQSRLTNNQIIDDYPTWSPDGKQIAFMSDRAGIERIHVMNADGSNQRGISSSTSEWDSYPAWSPDGTKIAFAAEYGGRSDIYIMNADGSNQTRLTTDPATDSRPTWSPDGTQIAFVSNRDGNFEIYKMQTDGSNQQRLTNNALWDDDPTWAPNGTQIVFDSNSDIYVINVDGSNQRGLTTNAAIDTDPTWSSDSTQIAFVSNRDGNFEIYKMQADGSNQQRLTNNTTHDTEPAWSPASSSPTTYSISGRVTDGHNHPLSGVFVGLLDVASDTFSIITTTTDVNGNFLFEAVEQEKTYGVRVVLRDGNNTSRVYWGDHGLLVYAQTQQFYLSSSQASVVMDVDFSNPGLDSGPIPVDLLDDLAAMYYHTTQVNDFIVRNLVLSNFSAVDSIWGFAPVGRDGFYNFGTQSITLGTDISAWSPASNGHIRPMNREWHENFHHLMNVAIGRPPLTAEEKNHGGYTNTTTDDSWAEGWAEFWPCVLWDVLGNPHPELYRMGASPISFEVNRQVWDSVYDRDGSPSREEFAVASLLWDLYDPKNLIDDDNVDLNLNTLWNIIGRTTPNNSLNDMRDVYEAFRQATIANEDGSPVTGVDIDQIFIAHGFYLDLNINRMRDSGEEVGWAGRDISPGIHRRNTPEVPKAYLKINVRNPHDEPVQNSSLLVEVHFDNSYYDYSYMIDLGNATGEMVYMELPPTRIPVTAKLTITHEQGRSDPYTITNFTYWDKVINSTTGYAEEQTFVIRYQLYLPTVMKN